MAEFKCSKCGKEIKSKAGLSRHESSCKVELNDEVLEKIEASIDDTAAERKEVNEESTIYLELKRRIDKLEHSIPRCYDAVTKHRLEQELADLKSKL